MAGNNRTSPAVALRVWEFEAVHGEFVGWVLLASSSEYFHKGGVGHGGWIPWLPAGGSAERDAIEREGTGVEERKRGEEARGILGISQFS